MGSFSILNNISGLKAQQTLNANNVNLSTTLERLSSGHRINSGADDAAGLQIANSLNANVYALNQAVQNANDGVGVAQIADGTLQEVTNLLTRAVTLSEEASTGTVDSSGRVSLNNEFTQIQAEIAQLATSTNFNGTKIFDPNSGLKGALSVFVGDTSSASSISVTISTITTSNASVTNLGGQNLATVDLTTQVNAASALTTITAALNGVSTMRAAIGAGMNRLQAATTVLTTQSQNTQSAESTIMDANIAAEVANLSKYQILAQTGMAALAQANTQSQNVLSLLKNL
jgi:flagellin